MVKNTLKCEYRLRTWNICVYMSHTKDDLSPLQPHSWRGTHNTHKPCSGSGSGSTGNCWVIVITPPQIVFHVVSFHGAISLWAQCIVKTIFPLDIPGLFKAPHAGGHPAPEEGLQWPREADLVTCHVAHNTWLYGEFCHATDAAHSGVQFISLLIVLNFIR